jgi:hypothetical protein
VKRVLVGVSLLTLALPQAAWAKGEFHPEEEFEQHPWVPIHIGSLDLSITKAVAYLMLGSVLTMALGIVLMRAASRSTRWRRRRSQSRDCLRRASVSGFRTSRA